MPPKTQNKIDEINIFIQKGDFVEETLSEKLKKIINKIPDKNLNVSEIINLLGNDGLHLFVSLLTVIFLIPVSIPGLSTVFGGLIFFIGISNLFNKSLWLPNPIKIKEFSGEKLRSVLNNGLKWLRFLEKISKPYRIRFLTVNKTASKINGIIILFGSVLLMLPFGLVPFSNTLPALTILLITVGILQKDGIIIILGYLSILLNLVYFGLFFLTMLIALKQMVGAFMI